MNTCKLSEVHKNNKCKVVNFEGGRCMTNKLSNLGIRVGKELQIINSSFMGGPITVMSGSTKVAIGRNMANRIIVEVNKL